MCKIKIKNTVHPFYIQGETVLTTSGNMFRIEDPHKVVFNMINQMVGKDAKEIYKEISDSSKEITLDAINDVISQLDELKLLEDSSFNETIQIDGYNTQRWSRNIDFFGAFCKLKDNKYDIQNKIKNFKITLLGLGGVGSHMLLDLVSMGFINITAVDFDTVDLSNLNRQIIYNEDDIGSKKIDSAKKRLDVYLPNNKINYIDKYIDSTHTVKEVIQGSDMVVCCIDRPPEALYWVNEACVKEGIPFISGGVDTAISIIYSVIPRKTGCFQCWKDSVEQNSSLMKEVNKKEIELMNSGTVPWRPAVVNLVAVHSGMILSEIVKYVMNLPLSTTNKATHFYFETLQTKVVAEWKHNKNCPVCGIS